MTKASADCCDPDGHPRTRCAPSVWWQGQPPAAEAFESELPFAVDTMNCPRWLRWILIPRLYAMIERGAALPSAFPDGPYFEEHCRGTNRAARYLVLLDHFTGTGRAFRVTQPLQDTPVPEKHYRKNHYWKSVYQDEHIVAVNKPAGWLVHRQLEN